TAYGRSVQRGSDTVLPGGFGCLRPASVLRTYPGVGSKSDHARSIVLNCRRTTMLSCTPFLLFDGNCAEAMKFYHVCFGGNLVLTKLGDTPMKNQFPPEKH